MIYDDLCAGAAVRTWRTDDEHKAARLPTGVAEAANRDAIVNM